MENNQKRDPVVLKVALFENYNNRGVDRDYCTAYADAPGRFLDVSGLERVRVNNPAAGPGEGWRRKQG